LAPLLRIACFLTVTAIMTERLINLVSPLAHKATDMRIADTDGSRRDWSGAVSPLIGDSLRGCDIDSENTTPRLPVTPGIRISTMATRTTTTSTTSSAPGPSADQYAAPQPDFTPGVNGLITNLVWNEVDKIQGSTAVPVATKPMPAKRKSKATKKAQP